MNSPKVNGKNCDFGGYLRSHFRGGWVRVLSDRRCEGDRDRGAHSAAAKRKAKFKILIPAAPIHMGPLFVV